MSRSLLEASAEYEAARQSNDLIYHIVTTEDEKYRAHILNKCLSYIQQKYKAEFATTPHLYDAFKKAKMTMEKQYNPVAYRYFQTAFIFFVVITEPAIASYFCSPPVPNTPEDVCRCDRTSFKALLTTGHDLLTKALLSKDKVTLRRFVNKSFLVYTMHQFADPNAIPFNSTKRRKRPLD